MSKTKSDIYHKNSITNKKNQMLRLKSINKIRLVTKNVHH